MEPDGALSNAQELAGQPWRTWNQQSGQSTVRNDVPASTAVIPLKLYKRVNVKHLESIAFTGLVSKQEYIIFSGYSAGTQYMQRDLEIGAVWLGTNTDPGSSMQPSEGIFVDLEVRISAQFRDTYLRDINAVMHGDDTKSATTVLCFAPIQPDCIFLTLSDETVDAARVVDKNTRLKVGTVAVKTLGLPDLRLLKHEKVGPTLSPDDDW